MYKMSSVSDTYLSCVLVNPVLLFILNIYNTLLGRNLSEDETFELLAAAVFMYLKRERMSKKFLNQDRYGFIIHRIHQFTY